MMMSLCVFRGSSPPEVVLPLPDWQPAKHPGSLGEVGPLIEHVYEVRQVLVGPKVIQSPLCIRTS